MVRIRQTRDSEVGTKRHIKPGVTAGSIGLMHFDGDDIKSGMVRTEMRMIIVLKVFIMNFMRAMM